MKLRTHQSRGREPPFPQMDILTLVVSVFSFCERETLGLDENHRPKRHTPGTNPTASCLRRGRARDSVSRYNTRDGSWGGRHVGGPPARGQGKIEEGGDTAGSSLRAGCCCFEPLTQARVGRAGPLVERRVKGVAGRWRVRQEEARSRQVPLVLCTSALDFGLESLPRACRRLSLFAFARRPAFHLPSVSRLLPPPDLRGRSSLVWACARWFGCTSFLLAMDLSIRCTCHLSESSASNASCGGAFRCGPLENVT